MQTLKVCVKTNRIHDACIWELEKHLVLVLGEQTFIKMSIMCCISDFIGIYFDLDILKNVDNCLDDHVIYLSGVQTACL